MLALLGFGFYLQYGTKAEIDLRREAAGWPKTTGTVTAAEITKINQAMWYFGKGGLPRRISADRFTPAITYHYQVGGIDYQASAYRNDLLSRAGEWSSLLPKQVEQIVTDHQPGKSISVSYNPDHPAQAYLDLDTSVKGQQTWQTAGYAFFRYGNVGAGGRSLPSRPGLG